MRARGAALGWLVATSMATARIARAAESAAPSPVAEDASTLEARQSFLAGADLVKKAQWAEALGAFERAAALKPHAITTHNIGACQRAMGRYTRARSSFAASIAQNDAAGGAQLSPSLVSESKAFVAEIDALLARVEVHLEPIASLAVDGRPVEFAKGEAGATIAVAGTREPGAAEAAPGTDFTLLLDPGAHVLVLSRAGYADAIVTRTFRPGERATLPLKLDTLPGTIHVETNQPGAVLSLDGYDVGVAPVDVARAAGSYKLLVQKRGFTPFDAQLVVHAGERLNVKAVLLEAKRPFYATWWFWSGAAVVLGGAAVSTYFLTREDPQRPTPSGGTLGWAGQVN